MTNNRPKLKSAAVLLVMISLTAVLLCGCSRSGPDPAKAQSHIFIGKSALRSHSYTDALTDFNKAIVADPRNANAHCWRAIAYLHLFVKGDSSKYALIGKDPPKFDAGSFECFVNSLAEAKTCDPTFASVDEQAKTELAALLETALSKAPHIPAAALEKLTKIVNSLPESHPAPLPMKETGR